MPNRLSYALCILEKGHLREPYCPKWRNETLQEQDSALINVLLWDSGRRRSSQRAFEWTIHSYDTIRLIRKYSFWTEKRDVGIVCVTCSVVAIVACNSNQKQNLNKILRLPSVRCPVRRITLHCVTACMTMFLSPTLSFGGLLTPDARVANRAVPLLFVSWGDCLHFPRLFIEIHERVRQWFWDHACNYFTSFTKFPSWGETPQNMNLSLCLQTQQNLQQEMNNHPKNNVSTNKNQSIFPEAKRENAWFYWSILSLVRKKHLTFNTQKPLLVKSPSAVSGGWSGFLLHRWFRKKWSILFVGTDNNDG